MKILLCITQPGENKYFQASLTKYHPLLKSFARTLIGILNLCCHVFLNFSIFKLVSLLNQKYFKISKKIVNCPIFFLSLHKMDFCIVQLPKNCCCFEAGNLDFYVHKTFVFSLTTIVEILIVTFLF